MTCSEFLKELTDYLDDTVSAAVQLPATSKMVIVQALELTPAG